MREEFSEHKSMVGLGMVARQANILVHIKRHNILESSEVPQGHGWQDDDIRNIYETYESFPCFTNSTSALYVGIGEEPVGKPRTKGFSGVGANSLMLSCHY